ncbi:hypothetical protein R9C00_07135 [Flammeovirgaceae bacterium SG7u.111]|nr:hypothetical protein [Flammeovirgaceae bacterium SG7u.132]WPO37218.1 hypothetical protein R9C00_07135 [Flammeovirgaceae bacterium SG7u.111]
MKYFLLFLLLGLCTQYAVGQYSYIDTHPNAAKINKRLDNWRKGTIWLNDGTQVKGLFSYNPLVVEGILKVQDGEKTKMYTANQVDGFAFYDYEKQTKRRYYTFPFTYNDIYNNFFFEILHEGKKYSLLGRESIFIMQTINDGYTNSDVYKGDYLLFIFENETGELQNIKRKVLFEAMEDKEQEVRTFMKKLNIHSVKKLENARKVFRYYDLLLDKDEERSSSF